MSDSRPRLIEVDLAKGLAIFLVVLGHLSARTPPEGNAWFEVVTGLIYEFHMPFFMFISGIVFKLTFPAPIGFSQLGGYLRSRVTRLAPGFLLFALIIWFGKVFGGAFLRVDNVQDGDLQELAQIFLQPGESVATSLWYIYVLLELTILCSFALVATRGRVAILLIGAFFLNLWFHAGSVSSLFAANLVCEFALFFSLGCVCAVDYDRFVQVTKRHKLIFYSLFLMSFLATQIVPFPLSKTIIGLFSIPAVFAFAASFDSTSDRKILLTLAEYTFTIYLMNTLVIGLLKGLIFKVSSWDGSWFLVYFPVLLSAGVIVPILLHKRLFSRVPLLGKITK